MCLAGGRAGGRRDQHVEVLSASDADGEDQERAHQRDSVSWSTKGEMVSTEGC